MDAKHTPGPWELQKPLFGEQHIYVHSENSVNGKVLSGRQHICVVPYEGKRGALAYHEMFNANARLITAAPDLIAALQVVLRDYAAVHGIGDVEMQPAIYQARAAIAKATKQEL